MSEHDQNDPAGQSTEGQEKVAEAEPQETVAQPQAPASIPPLPPPPPEGGDQSWLEADDPAPVKGPTNPPKPPLIQQQAPPTPPQAPPLPTPTPVEPVVPQTPPVPQAPQAPPAPGVPPPLPPLQKPDEPESQPDQRPQFGGPMFPSVVTGAAPTAPLPGPISGYAGPEQVEAAPDADSKSAEVAEAKVTQPFSFKPSGARGKIAAPDFKGRRGQVLGAVVLIVLLIAGFYFLWPSGGGQSRAVALQFHPAQQLRYRVSLVDKGTIAAGGVSVPIALNVNAVADMRVTSVAADGTATVAVTLGNFQVSSTPESWAKNVPNVIHTRMEIASNGSIVSGDFGLSQIAPTGETAPGIGQFAPFLPPGPVEAGATWNQSAKLQVLGDQTVTVGAVNKLLGFTQGDSGDVAVVTSVVTMPVSLSFPVADFAEMASSNPKKQEQIAASDVVLQAKGTSKVQMTSQISMETKDVISTHNSGSASLTLSASSASSGQQGQLIVHVTDSMTIDQIGTSAKSSASPKPNVSASKSPSQLFP